MCKGIRIGKYWAKCPSFLLRLGEIIEPAEKLPEPYK